MHLSLVVGYFSRFKAWKLILVSSCILLAAVGSAVFLLKSGPADGAKPAAAGPKASAVENTTPKDAAGKTSTTPKSATDSQAKAPAQTSKTGGASPSPTPAAQSGGGSGTSGTTTPVNKKIAIGIAVHDSNQTNSSEISDYANAVGVNPVFVEWFQSWSEPLYYGSQKTSMVSHGYTPVISWTSDSTPLTSISSGGQNTTLDSAAALAKQWPGTLYIRFDYEMNVASSAWKPSNLGETPADYVTAWRYVVDRFKTDGVTNVKWVWAPNVDCNGACPFSSYYPGSNYVDMVGLDGYNYAHVDGVAWESFAQLFQNSYNAIVALAPGKPVEIAEVASVEPNSTEISAGDNKAVWIQQMASYIPLNMPEVIALTWWSAEPDTGTFLVNSSPATLSAWQNYVITNTYFQASSF